MNSTSKTNTATILDFLDQLRARVKKGDIKALVLAAVGYPDCDGVVVAVGDASEEEWQEALSDLTQAAYAEEDDGPKTIN